MSAPTTQPTTRSADPTNTQPADLSVDLAAAVTVPADLFRADLAERASLADEVDQLRAQVADLTRTVTERETELAAVTDTASAYALELRETLDMLGPAMRLAHARGTEIARLRTELGDVRDQLAGATDYAIQLGTVVEAHGGCPGISIRDYALEGTVRRCPDCDTAWGAAALHVEVDDDDGELSSATHTAWVLLPSGHHENTADAAEGDGVATR